MNKFLIVLLFPLLVSGQQKTEAFKKIIFHTSMCMGKCPVYHLQIENNKQVKLYAQHVYKQDAKMKVIEDSSKIGYFTGTVDNQLFNSLIKELKKIDLDSLEFKGPTCCDGSVTSLIIYYRAKRKSLESMFPPEEARAVISILMQICQSEDLKRTTEKFAIEKDASTLPAGGKKPVAPKGKGKGKGKK